MDILLWAFIGFIMGFKASKGFYILMGLVTIPFAVVQLNNIFSAKDKSDITYIPLGIIFFFVLFMVIGAFLRKAMTNFKSKSPD
jgi:surface polysaccharide O-acyltransferase-like enzyme